MLSEDGLGRFCRVDNNNRNIPQLDLIDVTKLLCPESILFRCIGSNAPQISYQGEASRAPHFRDPCLTANNFIQEYINEGKGDCRDEGGLHGVPLAECQDSTSNGHLVRW